MQSEIFNKILSYKKAGMVASQLHQKGKKIVFAMGTFDVLHLGHILFLEQAKKFGDTLIVGIGSDKNVKILKGKNRPIYPEKLRAAMVTAIDFADYTVILTENFKNKKDDYSECLSKIKPDVFVLNHDDSAKKETRRITSEMGIKLKLIKRSSSRIPFISTTSTHKKIQKTF
ncbi:MAG: adenylyltransferase/cytidyltransferase family protein [Patescibacteria group bacterium]